MDFWTLRRTSVAVGLYLLLILSALGLDRFLHAIGLPWLGRYAGVVGTLTILLSFVYSLRKRRYILAGSPQALLDLHEVLCWIGAVLILVHAGIHLHAVLPWLATLVLLVVVASGFTGKVLLSACRSQVQERQQELREQGLDDEEIGRRLMLATLAVDVMRRWRSVHLPLTVWLAALVSMHVISILLFTR